MTGIVRWRLFDTNVKDERAGFDPPFFVSLRIIPDASEARDPGPRGP
jgi:hypothetical protein